MAGEGSEQFGNTKSEIEEVRCRCGALVARRRAGVVELYCRRCKRVIAVLAPPRSAGL